MLSGEPPQELESGGDTLLQARESEREADNSQDKVKKLESERLLDEIKGRMWKDGLADLLSIQGLSFISIGYKWVTTGKRNVGESESLQDDEIFVRLRDRCLALGVYHESRTESHARTGLDGVEREVFFCVDTYRYNFSVGSDSRIKISGPERLRRSEVACEASAEEGAHRAPGSLEIGDEVDCWRPLLNLQSISLERISCERPTCTLADVYSCSDPYCVQLTDPAEQFRLYFIAEYTLIELGEYFILSGVSILLALFGAEIRSSRNTKHMTAGVEVLFLVGLSLLVLRTSGILLLTFWSSLNSIASRLPAYLIEFIVIVLAVFCFRLVRYSKYGILFSHCEIREIMLREFRARPMMASICSYGCFLICVVIIMNIYEYVL